MKTAMNTTSYHPLIVDTDVGFDDLVALMLLLHDEEANKNSVGRLRLELITTVRGMTSSKFGSAIVKGLLKNLGVNHRIAVVCGNDELSVGGRTLDTIPWYADYLQALKQAVSTFALPVDATEENTAPRTLVETAAKFPGRVMLVCLGPLTNVAQACVMNKNFSKNVRKVIIMGGALRVPGNMTVDDGKRQTAELNFYCDPIAAHYVLNHAGFKNVVLLPLDGCCPLNTNRIASLLAIPMVPLNGNCFAMRVNQLIKASNGDALQYDSIVSVHLTRPKLISKKEICIVEVNPSTGACMVREAKRKEGYDDDDDDDHDEEENNGVASVTCLLGVNAAGYIAYIDSIIRGEGVEEKSKKKVFQPVVAVVASCCLGGCVFVLATIALKWKLFNFAGWFPFPLRFPAGLGLYMYKRR